MIKKNGHFESGRTMVETVLVLFLMVFVAVSAIISFRYLMDKHAAQVITKEVTMAYTNLRLKRNKSPIDWTLYHFSTAMNYQMSYRYDGAGNAFIKLHGVKKGVCEQLLKENKIFSFLTEENGLFDSCASENKMVISKRTNGGT